MGAAILAQIMQEREQQARNLVGQAQPGQTWDQVMSAKDFKRVFGRDPKPGEVIKPETVAHTFETMTLGELSRLRKEQPDLLATLSNTMTARAAMSATGSAATGTPTVASLANDTATQASRSDVAKTVELGTAPTQIKTGIAQADAAASQAEGQAVTMQTVADAVNKGKAAWQQLGKDSPDLQASIGFKTMFGDTQEGAKAKELGNQMTVESLKMGLQSLKDPNASPLAPVAKALGLQPAALFHAVATGTTQILDKYAEIIYAKVANRAEQETALTKADAAYAEAQSKLLGIAPTELLTLQRMIAEGKDIPAKFASQAVAIKEYSKLQASAAMATAQKNGDPSFLLVQELGKIATDFKDPKQQELFSDIARKSYAKMLLNSAGIVEPRVGSPQRSLYDSMVQKWSLTMPGIKDAFGPAFITGSTAEPGIKVSQGQMMQDLLKLSSDPTKARAATAAGVAGAPPDATGAGVNPALVNAAVQNFMSLLGGAQPQSPTAPPVAAPPAGAPVVAPPKAPGTP